MSPLIHSKLTTIIVLCQLLLLAASFQDVVAEASDFTRALKKDKARKGKKGGKRGKQGKGPVCPADKGYQCLMANVLDNVIIEDDIILNGVLLTNAEGDLAPNTQVTFTFGERDMVTIVIGEDDTSVLRSGGTVAHVQVLETGNAVKVNGEALSDEEIAMMQNYTYPNNGKFNYQEMTDITLAGQMFESEVWVGADADESGDVGIKFFGNQCRVHQDIYHITKIVYHCGSATRKIVKDCAEDLGKPGNEFVDCAGSRTPPCQIAVNTYKDTCWK